MLLAKEAVDLAYCITRVVEAYEKSFLNALSRSIRAEEQRTRTAYRWHLAVRLVIAICGTSVAAKAIGTATNASLIISEFRHG